MKIAFTTLGVLVDNWDQPQVKGFVDRVPDTFMAAESGAGFLDRAGRYGIGVPVTDWGEIDPPGFLNPEQHPRVAATLSVWEDLESVFAFAYAGVHGESLRHRKEWFTEPQWPTYAAWWIEDDRTPDWQEVKTRLETLHEKGSTPQAFTLKQPYGPDGVAVAIVHARVKEKIEKNAGK